MAEREFVVKEWRDDKGILHIKEVGQELIRCKECMHQAKQTLIQGEIYDMPCCKKGMRISNDNGFCSYGERKESE